VAQLVAALRYKPEGRRFNSSGMIYWNKPQTPRQMSTTTISWSRCIGLTNLPLSCAWEPQPPGTLRACPDVYMDCFTFLYTYAAICFNHYMIILRLIKHIKTKITIAYVIYGVRLQFLT
jgi:hypothetical protein